jgi:hypothetical protein
MVRRFVTFSWEKDRKVTDHRVHPTEERKDKRTFVSADRLALSNFDVSRK